MKKKILDNIIYVLGILAALFFFIFKDNKKVLVIGLCAFLILISIFLIFNKNTYGVLGLIVGLMMGVSISLYYFKAYPLYLCFSLLFISSLFFIMLYTLIKYYLEIRKAIKTHNMEVEAKIIDFIKNPNLSKEIYVPVLEYTVNEEVFEVNYFKGFTKNIPEIGDIMVINVNPNDYFDVYYKPSVLEIIKNCIISIIIMLFSLLFMVDILL